MRESYMTAGSSASAELLIQKSRFIGYVARAQTEQEAAEFIDSIKSLHRSANHNCSAYMLGENDNIQKANDDGEPSGTAGVPILEVLKKKQLKDTVIVVTRYFGGIKLGSGGLIRAYGTAASEALAAAGIVERRLHSLVKVSMDYSWLGKVENEVRQSEYPLKDIEYTESVNLYVYVPVQKEELFSIWLQEMTNGQSSLNCTSKEYLEFPFI
ncbi:YigZ family protein [Metaplanococcus flavidus]|uniref:YigZ family protein n=1 Tax=Metaplanococcus flavidus TaxID=569883 RepID=A0ABW3LAV8_9BACL